jgi:hypothetical protein
MRTRRDKPAALAGPPRPNHIKAFLPQSHLCYPAGRLDSAEAAAASKAGQPQSATLDRRFHRS